MKTDLRIDAYIAAAPEYARPILKHIRKVVHAACPDVQETVKWRYPTFEYKGIMCGMAAFKNYATFGFWKAKLLADRGFPEATYTGRGEGGRLTSIGDLPSERVLTRIIKEAAKINEEGLKVERPKMPKKAPVKPPSYFIAAVKKNKKAHAHYQTFSPTKRRDYVEWITDAKNEDTRLRRLAQAVTWMAEGKSRNWKYERA